MNGDTADDGAFVAVISGGFLFPNENMFEVIVGGTAAVEVLEANVVVTGVPVFVRAVPTFFIVLPVPNENALVDVLEKLNPPEDGVVEMDVVEEGSVVVGTVAGKPDNVAIGDVTPGFPKLN